MAGDIIDPEAASRPQGPGRRCGPAGSTPGGCRPSPSAAVRCPGGYGAFGPLAKHVRYVERASRKLARSTFYAMARWQGKLERKQSFLARVVDIGAELFAMSAACVRARAERAEHPEGVELADLFCRQARRRVDATLPRAVAQHRRPRRGPGPQGRVEGDFAAFEEGVVTPAAEGDWVASWEPGASTETDVRRRIPR